MKFSDYKYDRPDIIKLETNINDLLDEFNLNCSLENQIEIIEKINILRNNFETMKTLVEIRYSLNTEDEFYLKENEYMDEISPIYEGFIDKYYKSINNSKFKLQLSKIFGDQIFNIARCKLKSFSDNIIEELKIENKLTSQYVKLRSSAKIIFDGQERNIPQMQPFIESKDQKLRIAAQKALNLFFENNENEFDKIYDEMVKVRHKMALKLGYENYVELGYLRLLRTDYDSKMVGEYRKLVHKYIVPITLDLKERQRKRLNYKFLKYYDDPIMFPLGNATPKGDGKWILKNGIRMYKELSRETGEFFEFMMENELLDVFARKGKAGGGYCTYLSDYKSPYIFSNFNGTSGDIDVLTHEAGHAFQSYLSRDFKLPEYIYPTLEACEIHSMSMEFITWPWMKEFFKEDTDKYKFSHLSGALLFIPYGVLVDEFQEWVYENPEVSPKKRKEIWRTLEKKYLPYIDYDDNSFLDRGGYWFRQGHIFGNPFYYIDYTLAQVLAFQFWVKSRKEKAIAWKSYIDLCRQGGSKSFFELLEIANLENPFFEENFKRTIDEVVKWLNTVDDIKFY